jgi:NitT/TauT family transport system ATP-binding protein
MSVARGEFVSIVGPSGCGKSTLLKIVAGLLSQATGEVLIGGGRVDRPQSNIGIVFQSPVLMEWRTVLKNILILHEELALIQHSMVERFGIGRQALREKGADVPFQLLRVIRRCGYRKSGFVVKALYS